METFIRESSMNQSEQQFSIEVENTNKRCAIGETVGNRNIHEKRMPALSCEGACIKGEIARLAANLVAKEKGFARACHGELLSVPDSAMANWVKQAEKTVLIDGCGLRCHGRILENLLGEKRLVQFNALAIHKKYADVFDIDEVPEEERLQAARQVAERVLATLKEEVAN
jgi:uncharacterized metal-binding protein